MSEASITNILDNLNVKTYTIFEVFGELLQKDHTEMIKIKGPNNRFVYPDFPEADSSYPQIVLKLDNIDYQGAGAGNFLYAEAIPNGYKAYYGKLATATLNLYVMSSKKTITSDATNKLKFIRNGEELYLSDQVLNSYLGNIAKEIIWNEVEKGSFYRYGLKVKQKPMKPAFEDGKNKWTTQLSYDIEYIDFIVLEYYNGGLLRQYSLNLTVQI